ncbi:MAG: hypothetical protein KKD18_06100 [Nanoarchaeota archaeon]|nr:hypothetical protein [Nanoarchaeota archaeon]
MVSDKMKKALTDASYLKRQGWSFEMLENVGWGWIDPKTKEHYFEREALQIQLIRDASKNKRFGPEPHPF